MIRRDNELWSKFISYHSLLLIFRLSGMKFITDDLIEDSEPPVGCFLPDRPNFEHDKNYTQEVNRFPKSLVVSSQTSKWG